MDNNYTKKPYNQSLSDIKNKIKFCEKKYAIEGYSYAHLMMKTYMKAIDYAIENHHFKYADLWLTQSLSVYSDIKDHVMYSLIPGLDMIHLNERALYYMHHPLYGLMHYYHSYMISLTKDKKGFERSVDQAIAILTYKNQKLNAAYRQTLFKTIELKQSLIDLDDCKQLELVNLKKKLFRNDEHLYRVNKELGDLAFNQLSFTKAAKNYHKMNCYAKHITWIGTDELDKYINALERLTISCIHQKKFEKAEETIQLMIESINRSSFQINTHVEYFILPHQLDFYVSKMKEDLEHMISAYQQIKILLEKYAPFNKQKHHWVDSVIHELHKDLISSGYNITLEEDE